LRAPADAVPATVIVLEDDEHVQAALQSLLRSVGFRVCQFSSVDEYLRANLPDMPGCMIVDIRLPGQSGLDFYEQLCRNALYRAVIFISGHADIQMSVRAMKAGAVEFLAKPVRDQDLLDAVQAAVERDCKQRRSALALSRLQAAFASLTPREREIMGLVVDGRRNKQIADDVGISEATVKLHRGHMMQKMNAQSLASLVRMADALGGIAGGKLDQGLG
jgi:FixJ family two-component response regulator